MQNDAFAIFYHWFDSLRGARTVARDLQTAMAFRETDDARSLLRTFERPSCVPSWTHLLADHALHCLVSRQLEAGVADPGAPITPDHLEAALSVIDDIYGPDGTYWESEAGEIDLRRHHRRKADRALGGARLLAKRHLDRPHTLGKRKAGFKRRSSVARRAPAAATPLRVSLSLAELQGGAETVEVDEDWWHSLILWQ